MVNASFAPADPASYDPARFPAFIVADDRPELGGTPALRGDGIYGVPFISGEGLKVGAGGTPVDPDQGATLPPGVLEVTKNAVLVGTGTAPVRLGEPKSAASPVNALQGLLVFGIPALTFLLGGRNRVFSMLAGQAPPGSEGADPGGDDD